MLRIEDTDAARNRPEWTEGILSRAGLDRHRRGAATRARTSSPRTPASTAPPPPGCTPSGRAYYCDCTREDVQARTGNAAPGLRRLLPRPRPGPGEGRALRFRTPDEGETVVVDLIRGEPTFENKLIEDFVIARGDGSPVFLLANVVDDMTMGITHVIRAEEHLPNTPKQQLLWEALGATPPIWAHVPVVVNEKRQKLSKRRDKVALEAYRDEGYLADAMRNYLMLLGWAPSGDREIVPWSVIEDGVPAGGRQPLPGVLRREEAARVQRRVHPGAAASSEFIAACQPWLTGTDDHRAAAVAAGGVRPGRVRRGRPAGADPDRGARRDRAERRLPVPGRAG